MIKLKHLVASALLVTMPMQVMAAANTNMVPIISYLLSDSKPVLSDDEKWADGKVMNYFWLDEDDGEPEVGYATVTLGGGSLTINEYDFNITSQAWNPGSDDEKLNQTTGAWEVPSVYNYVIDPNDENILTINGAKSIRIDKVTDLSGMTVTFGEAPIAIPIIFSTGALKYDLSEKVLVDTYELEWTPTVWDHTGNTRATYSSLESYMNSGGCFYYDDNTQTCIDAQRNTNMDVAVDSNGAEIATLTLGNTGNLVTVDWSSQPPHTQTVVGTWTAINLPGSAQSGIVTIDTNLSTTTPNYSNYMEDGKKLATMHENVVEMVEFQTAMTSFVADDEDVAGNSIAMNDIKTAVEAYQFPVPPLLDVKAYFENATRYFVNAGALKGERTLDGGGNYIGSLDIPNVGYKSISGTYSVTNNVITFRRTEKGGVTVDETIVLTHTASMPDSNNEVFSVTFNGRVVFVSISFDSQGERDSYSPLEIVGNLSDVEYLTAMTNVTPVVGSTWYEIEFENGIFSLDGRLDINTSNTATHQEGAKSDVFYYRAVNDTLYGDVLGLSKTVNGTIGEYVKFSAVLDQADLIEMFPLVPWTSGAEGVVNAGATNGEEFDAWDNPPYDTVAYADFGAMITGMKAGVGPDDDNFIIGNGLEALYFATATASNATSGTIIKGDGTTAGSFEYKVVDSVTLLVVTITAPNFDDHIAFKDTGAEITRGEIYDRWAGIMLNDTAKSLLVQ